MRGRGWFLGLALALGAQAALANPPTSSPRPMPRPDLLAAIDEVVATVAPGRSLRPVPRPDEAAPAATASETVAAILRSVSIVRPAAASVPTEIAASALAVARSARPAPRPRDFEAIAAAAVAAPRATSPRGSICGVAEIKGEVMAPIPGPGACGIDKPVRVTAVSGVALRQAPTIDCTTARALNDWVRNGVIPAVGRKGGGVARLNVIAHYSCRTRNSQKGARLSEHALGHAVDVAGVTLRDGTTLTVEDHWRSSRFGKVIRAMHSSACGTFGTVLGPSADRYHQDHLHVDTARYRGGAYCR